MRRHGALLSPALRAHLFYLNDRCITEGSEETERLDCARHFHYAVQAHSLAFSNPPCALGGRSTWTWSMAHLPSGFWLVHMNGKDWIGEQSEWDHLFPGFLCDGSLYYHRLKWGSLPDHSRRQETICYNNGYYLWFLVNFPLLKLQPWGC